MSSKRSTAVLLALLLAFLAAPAVAGAQSADSLDRSERVVRALRPAVEIEGREGGRWTIAQRMAEHAVPGVSIAVVEGGRIAWARGFGVRQAGSADSVTAETRFQAASISKVIAATATLRLVEQGRLDLDADVNRQLTLWRVPENRFTEREKVTLRRILSHTAGLTVHGFRGYGPGQPVPTTLQVLDGVAPATSAPVRVDTTPGAVTRYSGGGTTVQQLVLEEVMRQPFPRLMDALVLAPLGMAHSTFEQPLPPPLFAGAARGHDAEGHALPGGGSVYAEMAAGGLWTTPTDLLRLAVAIDQARDGAPGGILSQAMAAQMLTVQKDLYGLGPELEGTGRAFRFGHGGSNPGFRAQLTYFPETGQGAVVMVNGDGGDLLIDEIQRGIAAEYGWPALAPVRMTPADISEAATLALTGEYAMRTDPASAETLPATVSRDGGRILFGAPPLLSGDEIVPESDTSFVSPLWGYRIVFDVDASGRATGFTLTYAANVFTATRAP
jgi:CubicO group peptidase (beta-lactamase class C family)